MHPYRSMPVRPERDLFWTRLALFSSRLVPPWTVLFYVSVVDTATAAAAAAAGAPVDPLDWFQLVMRVSFAIGVIASTASFVLGFVGNYYPPALKWAMRASDIALRLHGFGLWVASLLPGGQEPKAATLKSFAPRPSLIDMCSQCGGPVISKAVPMNTNRTPGEPQ